jgi:amphi-Trp domain-containing protein
VLGPKQPVALALRIGSNREPSVGENKLTLTLGWERARPAPKMPGRQCHGKGDREDMASQHLGVKSKATMSEVIGHLEHLVASLKEGQLCIRKNDKVITLKPQDPLLIEIEAETRFDKESLREKLVIRMKWRKGQPRPAEGDAYTITHGEAPSEA